MGCFSLYYTVLYFAVWHCTVLYGTVQYCFVLYCTVLCALSYNIDYTQKCSVHVTVHYISLCTTCTQTFSKQIILCNQNDLI